MPISIFKFLVFVKVSPMHTLECTMLFGGNLYGYHGAICEEKSIYSASGFEEYR